MGESSNKNPIKSIEDWADDIEELVKAISIDKFIILGVSIGGGVALQYAAKYQ